MHQWIKSLAFRSDSMSFGNLVCLLARCCFGCFCPKHVFLIFKFFTGLFSTSRLFPLFFAFCIKIFIVCVMPFENHRKWKNISRIERLRFPCVFNKATMHNLEASLLLHKLVPWSFFEWQCRVCMQQVYKPAVTMWLRKSRCAIALILCQKCIRNSWPQNTFVVEDFSQFEMHKWNSPLCRVPRKWTSSCFRSRSLLAKSV